MKGLSIVVCMWYESVPCVTGNTLHVFVFLYGCTQEFVKRGDILCTRIVQLAFVDISTFVCSCWPMPARQYANCVMTTMDDGG